MVIQVCQLLSFPFALDVDKDTLALIMEAVKYTEIPAQLLQVLSWPPFPPYCGDPSLHCSPQCMAPLHIILAAHTRCHLGAMQSLEKLDWLLSLR